MKYPLNAFQRLMLQWKQFCVYNACQAVELTAEPDLFKLQSCWQDLINQLGVGLPRFGKNFVSVSYESIKSNPIIKLQQSLASVLQWQINEPYASDAFPLRCFIVVAESNSIYLVICYDHWVADSYSIRKLLLTLVGNVFQSQTKKLNLYADHFKQNYGNKGQMSCLTSWKHIFSQARRFSSVTRTEIQNHDQFNSNIHFALLPTELMTKLKFFAKQRLLTLNDLFIATFAVVIGEILNEQRQEAKKKFLKPRRNRIAIGTVVDLRRYAIRDLGDVFGQFLGNFPLLFSDRELATPRLFHYIQSQTNLIKRKQHAVHSYLAWQVMQWMLGKQRSLDSKAKYHHKTSSLNAAISNVNLNQDPQFPDLYSAGIIKSPYYRVSPTGPICPLLLTITGFENDLNVAITYRTSAYQQQSIEQIYQRWLELLFQWTR